MATEMDGASTGKGGAGLVVVISAPSGGGKTTLCRNLEAQDDRICRVVTCTTREPRGVERDGVDYHFLSRATFEARVAAGEFLEHAEVHGHRYGTLIVEVQDCLRKDRDVLVNLDVQGAASVRRVAQQEAVLGAALVTVFFTPSSPEVLEARLRGRGTEDEEAVARRLRAAQAEVDRWWEFDYLLVSGTEAEDVERLRMIVAVERMRSRRSAPPWR